MYGRRPAKGSRARGNRFGKLLRRCRVEAGYSLRGFASELGLSPGHLSRVETGHESPPPASRIVQIARLLDIDQDELLASAGKLHPELVGFICKNQRIVEFLRAAFNKGYGNAYFDELIEGLPFNGPAPG